MSRPSRPRVVHVIAPAAFGGLEQVVLQLAEGRAARDLPTAAIALLSPHSEVPLLVPLLERAGVRTAVVRSAHRAYLSEQRAMRNAISGFGADIVHTHGYRTDVLAPRPAQQVHATVVSTAHGFTGVDVKNRVFEWLERRAWRRFDAVVAVSGPLRARIVASGVPDAVVHLCPNAWSGAEPLDRAAARAELGLPPSDRLIGWIGRLSIEKGADVMVCATPHLPPDVGVVMVGEGGERASLVHRAAELGVSARIRWTGVVPNAGHLAAAFDAFVLSSRTEGTPMVLFEAMAARVPIVATAVGGVPDVVTPLEATLVRPDAPQELASAITATLSDGHGTAQRVAAARRRLDAVYAPGPWLDRYEAIYQAAAARAAARQKSRH